MNFSDYQKLSQATDVTPDNDPHSMMIPLLGLAGEAGSLLTEFKKSFRDGDRYKLFKDRVEEELGDVLWYISNIAHKNGIELEDIAQRNLFKTMSRWRPTDVAENLPGIFRPFDLEYPPSEQLPMNFKAVFVEISDEHGLSAKITVNDEVYGDVLTDNAYVDDGYRFHDVFHLAYMGVLGWSPVSRRNLGRKRRSNLKIDEVEDGGRAIVIEEAISALVFQYAEGRSFFEGYESVEYELLQIIQRMSKHLEVHECSAAQWETAILDGYKVWRQIHQNRGGILHCNNQKLSFEPSS